MQLIARKAHPDQVPPQEVCTPSQREAVPVSSATDSDTRYTIDNMLVERAIRPFTVHRKNSLFFSSEEGVETALTFFTLIETCKNVGLNARDYITTVIRLMMNGNALI